MKTIEKTVYTFEELSDKAKDKVRQELGDDACNSPYESWDYEIENSSLFKETMCELSRQYCENSQGPYWGNFGEGIEAIFSDFFTSNKGQLRKMLGESREDLHWMEKAFLEDCDLYFSYIAFDPWDESLFYDGDKFERFYASNFLRSIYDYSYEKWEWYHSKEYVSDLCEANEYFFNEDGSLEL